MEESFFGSVKLMVFVYALAATISFVVAWVIKLIFAGIQKQKAGADARNGTPPEAPAEVAPAAHEQKA